MSITYQQALSTLTTMFATADIEVIKMVLEQNRGHMEKTIEQLLEMTGAESAAPTTPTTPTSPRTDLPDDFLSFGAAPPGSGSVSPRSRSAQEASDEALARMLQNMDASMALRDPAYAHHIPPGAPRPVPAFPMAFPFGVPPASQRPIVQPSRPAAQSVGVGATAGAVAAGAVVGGAAVARTGSTAMPDVNAIPTETIQQKLATMGDAAKRKFTEIAAIFNTGTSVSGSGTTHARYSSLQGMDEDDEQEVVSFDRTTVHRRPETTSLFDEEPAHMNAGMQQRPALSSGGGGKKDD
jgi:hypothetical protein